MTQFIWSITSMEAYTQINGLQDVVFNVNWQCQALDEIAAASSSGSVLITYTAGSAFTPYDQLTQDQVWGWINPSIDRTEIEANLQAMLDKQKNPPVVTPPLPWSN